MKYFSLVLATSLSIFNFSGTRPDSLGGEEGKLSACPGSPNCVSTLAQDELHRIAPLHYGSSREHTMGKLITVVKSMKRSKIVTVSDHYLHVEFSSLIFRFVDDVEFALDDTTGTVHFRSAARLGYSDFGVNRKRMEEIRSRYNAL